MNTYALKKGINIMENILRFNKPAEKFEEAMPLGNGRIGAMVYANPGRDKISLNEDTI